ERPLFPHQPSRLVPVRLLHGEAHFLRHLGDALEAILHGAFAADLRFEDFPIVDAVLPRLSRITNGDAAFQLVEIDAQLDAVLAAWLKLDGRGAAKSWRVMILRAGGNIDDDGFGVTADVNPIDLALPCSGVAVQRRA